MKALLGDPAWLFRMGSADRTAGPANRMVCT